jgi:hypothetical protein
MNTELYDSFYHNDGGLDLVVDLTHNDSLNNINNNNASDVIPSITNVHHMQTHSKSGVIKPKINLSSIYSLIS